MFPETGTIPAPRDPLSERELRHTRRLLNESRGIEAAVEAGGVDAGIRQLALLGHEFAALASLDEGAKRVYLLAVVNTLRRAAVIVDPPPQGIA